MGLGGRGFEVVQQLDNLLGRAVGDGVQCSALAVFRHGLDERLELFALADLVEVGVCVGNALEVSLGLGVHDVADDFIDRALELAHHLVASFFGLGGGDGFDHADEVVAEVVSQLLHGLGHADLAVFDLLSDLLDLLFVGRGVGGVSGLLDGLGHHFGLLFLGVGTGCFELGFHGLQAAFPGLQALDFLVHVCRLLGGRVSGGHHGLLISRCDSAVFGTGGLDLVLHLATVNHDGHGRRLAFVGVACVLGHHLGVFGGCRRLGHIARAELLVFGHASRRGLVFVKGGSVGLLVFVHLVNGCHVISFRGLPESAGCPAQTVPAVMAGG